MNKLMIASGLFVLSFGASAADFRPCLKIKADTERLACYDKVAASQMKSAATAKPSGEAKAEFNQEVKDYLAKDAANHPKPATNN